MYDSNDNHYQLELIIGKYRNMKNIITILAIAVMGMGYSSYQTAQAQEEESVIQEESNLEIVNETSEVSVSDQKNSDDSGIVEKKEYYEIVIKDHKFYPEELIIPAGQKVKLIVDNQDPTPEEFESYDLNREKIISGNKKATIFIGPLKPGKYHYFGEFNMDSANGYIIAK